VKKKLKKNGLPHIDRQEEVRVTVPRLRFV